MSQTYLTYLLDKKGMASMASIFNGASRIVLKIMYLKVRLKTSEISFQEGDKKSGNDHWDQYDILGNKVLLLQLEIITSIAPRFIGINHLKHDSKHELANTVYLNFQVTFR